MRPIKSQKVIEPKVEVCLAEKENNGFKSQLRIVRWVVDGKVGEPLLEKRSFRKKKDGTFSLKGKASGFNKADWHLIMDSRDEIGVFFQ